MIEGIRIDMSSDELRRHVEHRAEYHGNKAAAYEKQQSSLQELQQEQTNNSNDPVSSLKRSREDHLRKMGYFSVIAKHIIPNEIYRLSEADLSRLEIYSEFY